MADQKLEEIASATLGGLQTSLKALTKAATGKDSNIKVEDERASFGGGIAGEAVTIKNVPPAAEAMIRDLAWQAGITISGNMLSDSGGKIFPLTFDKPQGDLEPEYAAANTPNGKLEALTHLADKAARAPATRAQLAIDAFNAATKDLPPDEQIAAFGEFARAVNLPPAVKQQLMRATGEAARTTNAEGKWR